MDKSGKEWLISIICLTVILLAAASESFATTPTPSCPDCQKWDPNSGPSGECVDDDTLDETGGDTGTNPDECGYCQKCSDGICVNDDEGGNSDDVCRELECESCHSGECETDCTAEQCCDDDVCVSSCPGSECCDDGTCVSSCPSDECKICAAGTTCIDRCPIIGKHCDGAGNCEECITDAHCTIEDHYGCGCEDHECEDCWEFSTVSKNEVQPCPECDDVEGGCYSTYKRIPEEYAVYANILNPPEYGQIGVCGLHYKTGPVRFLTTCVEHQTDAQKIAELVNRLINLGFDVSSIAGCTQCAGGNAAACPGCFAGLIVDEIWDSIFNKCFFVEGCNRCPWDDTSCSNPLTTPNVVDLSAVDLCCGTE